MYCSSYNDYFSIGANVCGPKSWKRTYPGLDPVTPIKLKETPQSFLVVEAFLLTSAMHKTNSVIYIVFYIIYYGDYHFKKQFCIKPSLRNCYKEFNIPIIV